MTYRIRSMRIEDVEGVVGVQAEAYVDIALENAAFFLNRLALAPAHCWVAVSAADHVEGYLIAYPWVRGLPPTLNVALDRLPDIAISWFLHDCAVHPQARGNQLGERLLAAGWDQARALGFDHASLVSLESANAYWRQQGYAAAIESPALTEKLVCYGRGARYMTRDLAP